VQKVTENMELALLLRVIDREKERKWRVTFCCSLKLKKTEGKT
jgi:hypothetical protein